MAAGLVVPVSGPYTCTFNGLPLGTQGDDGFQLNVTLQGQEVNESDAYGMTLVEGIYRGQNWRLRLRGLEWNKTGLLSIVQMFGWQGGNMPGATANTLAPTLGAIGDRWTKYCQALVLTAILGNPPTTPQTLTATNAGFAPNTNTEMIMTSKVREMPIEMVLIPYVGAGSSAGNLPFSVT
jgi:hypothetical protein